MTKYRNPNYEVIHFENFINCHLGIDNCFLPEEQIQSIRVILTSRGLNERSCFIERGTIKEVFFKSMKFYQPEVGISGPKYTSIDEPVNVLLFRNDYILWNGYHRSLIKIFSGKLFVRGYVLQLD